MEIITFLIGFVFGFSSALIFFKFIRKNRDKIKKLLAQYGW